VKGGNILHIVDSGVPFFPSQDRDGQKRSMIGKVFFRGKTIKLFQISQVFVEKKSYLGGQKSCKKAAILLVMTTLLQMF
jgi:hypothetical protein